MRELYYFTAGWCQPCQVLGPTMSVIGQRVPVRKVDVDYTPDIIEKFNVRNIPTVILVENGNEIRRFTGVKSHDEIMNFVNS